MSPTLLGFRVKAGIHYNSCISRTYSSKIYILEIELIANFFIINSQNYVDDEGFWVRLGKEGLWFYHFQLLGVL